MPTVRWFPISYSGPRKGPTQVPWDAIAPHGAQARANHGGQDLETLARRGGLSPCEFIAIMEDRPWLGGLVEEDRGRELAAELIRAQETWVAGRCAACSSDVRVMSCPYQLSPTADYLWWCVRDKCDNNTRPQHTGDQEWPTWALRKDAT